MTVWAEGDALSPSNLNNNSASATSVAGFSTNTLSAETGSSISALGNLVSASTFSAGDAFVAAAGSAIAPAVRFASEQSLGFYRSAASELATSYGTFVPSDVSATGQGAFSNISSDASIVVNEAWASGVSVGSIVSTSRLSSSASIVGNDVWASNVSAGTLTVTGAGDSSFVGQVGIGLTNPTRALEINGGTNVILEVAASDANSSANILLKNDAAQWDFTVDGGDGDALKLLEDLGGGEVMSCTPGADVIIGDSSAIATNATAGFLLIPGCAGTPTGDPVSDGVGAVALVYDTTNNLLYANDGGGWVAVNSP